MLPALINLLDISIHALVKRATGRTHWKGLVIKYFNPRPREEGDLKKLRYMITLHISIHALVKRATVLNNILGF